MRLIGLRANPNKILYSVVDYDGDECAIVNQDVVIPVSFDLPQKLKYIRKTFLDILGEYDILRAGIKLTEYSTYQSPDTTRVMIEGVIQELLASSKTERYFSGTKNSISAKLGIPIDGTISHMIDGTLSFRELNGWESYSKEHRECILTAFAVYNT